MGWPILRCKYDKKSTLFHTVHFWREYNKRALIAFEFLS
jgi:hypothetical protein